MLEEGRNQGVFSRKGERPLFAADLFCGAGGCSEGLIQAGFHVMFSSDVSEEAGRTYTARHEALGLIQGKNTWFELCDVRDLSGKKIKDCLAGLDIFQEGIPETDLMVGGPSCQGFSRAGRRDSSDPRNMLFGEYVRVVSEVCPKYVVLENVEGFADMQFFGFRGRTGILYPDGTTTPEILKSELGIAGYTCLPFKVLNAADYGVPQMRKRIIFIAFRNGLPAPEYPAPIRTQEEYEMAGKALMDTKSKYAKESAAGRTPDISGHTISCQNPKNTERSAVSDVVKERFSLFRQGETGAMLRKRIREEGTDLSGLPALLDLLMEKTGMERDEIIRKFSGGGADNRMLDALLTRKIMRRRLDGKAPAPTMLTVADDFIHPEENRALTVREMARLQSFDDSFEFLGKRTTGGIRRRFEIPQQTQVGNAVPPLLMKAVAEEIRKVLLEKPESTS